ncbi:MAG: DUF2309 domain-containing protein [Halobacteriales archaeon]|nr:DUF2309 domain-containing protein [Halobacteriales archaeon]
MSETKTESQTAQETEERYEKPDTPEEVEEAAAVVGKAWPLHSFVTANPLAGFENEGFHDAVESAGRVLGGSGYPDAETFRWAWESGRIDEEELRAKLGEYGYDTDAEPDELLRCIEDCTDAERNRLPEGWDEVNRIVSKWMATFLDQDRSEWAMPGRSEGFYAAWRELAPYDDEVPDGACADLPDDPVDAVESFVSGIDPETRKAVFESQFAALPGWAALVRRRTEDDVGWQDEYPVSLVGYLAVRLALTDAFGAPLAPEDWYEKDGRDTDVPLAGVWLEAWEETYRRRVADGITATDAEDDEGEAHPDAQLAFCIDTRSEVIRRHVEEAGNYETHGYAGFFGVPMRYEGYGDEFTVDAHPPILEPEHRVADVPADDSETHNTWAGLGKTVRGLAKSLQTNVTTAFTFVEKSGVGYAAALLARTLLPATFHDAGRAVNDRVPDVHEFCDLELDADGRHEHDGLPRGMTLDEKVEYAATAFELTGWDEFARLVVFVGHASQTANNPFDSALDCGACAANPGGPSARVLAAICNDDEVRAELRDRGIEIPDKTQFVAAEHNTTTDEVVLFDSDVPEIHREEVESLRVDLREAREGATEERAGSVSATRDGIRETQRRSSDWAETRPEWGLAGNAAFVVGPRSVTEDVNLDGRVFLHSYDPDSDDGGEALEAIMLGPMVVTQWISAQYYFASVDNAVYGSGSKVTQNPVGNVAVFQGNGGDAMTGLPFESLYAAHDLPYHQPLRLSVFVYAPADRVERILDENDDIARLFDNGWLYLTVVEPDGGRVTL